MCDYTGERYISTQRYILRPSCRCPNSMALQVIDDSRNACEKRYSTIKSFNCPSAVVLVYSAGLDFSRSETFAMYVFRILLHNIYV